MAGPLAGPGPYAADTNNPALLCFYKLNTADFERWKTQGRVSLRELFLRNGYFEWWWFEGLQHNAVSDNLYLLLNGGEIGQAPMEHAFGTVNSRVYVDRFEGDIIVRPGDFLEIYGYDNGVAWTQCGTITVPNNEVWILVAWKVYCAGQE